MCGIAGFYGFQNDDLIKKISGELRHRGPDGDGFYFSNNVTLLNRRLAIIDRKGGDQPIYNEVGSIVVTYNGEIYNYRELSNNLKKLGHKFKTKSDTEVIIHGYEEWGTDCFDKLNGMFAVALYDIKKEKLILVRDHFGIKPLYYSILDSSTPKIIFSSEIKPIINSDLVQREPNDRIIYRYLRFRVHDDQQETFFKEVYRLMPGELVEVSTNKLEVREYTNLKSELLSSNNPEGSHARKLSKDEISKFQQKLINAIRLRLISEVPVGTCLSGGLDSSTIVSAVNKLLKEKVKEAESVGNVQNTFSAVFPGSGNDEEIYVDKLVKRYELGVRSHKIYPKPEEFFRDLEDFIRTQEEPTISTGPYAQYKVMQEAHKYVTVLLDGQGADEMMAGYIPYYFVYLKQLFYQKKYFSFIKEIVLSFDLLIFTLINRLIEMTGIKQCLNRNKLFNKNFVNEFKQENFIVTNNNLKQRLIEDIFSNSLQSLLRYEDKNAMSFSIEGRVPFLDFNLIRFLFTLSDEAIIKNGWNKYILRESMKELLPELIRKRRNKIGFTTPEKEWFLRMKNKIYSIFLSDSFAGRKYFNQPEVLKAFQLFIEEKFDDSMLFWRLLNVEIWLRIFIDKNSKKQETRNKERFLTNKGKKLEIKVDGKTYLRYPIRTELFKKGDDIPEKITKSFSNYLVDKSKGVPDQVRDSQQLRKNAGWFIVVSEKIVAIAQGRSYLIWDIKTGFWAKILSKFVKKTPYGIGLGSLWTMQLAINEIGLPKILFASLLGGLGKLGILGKLGKGIFYKITGSTVAAIDGPTEYSLYPSNVSAKLGPKEPEKVTEVIKKTIVSWLHGFIVKNSNEAMKQLSSNFLGVVIIDANDLGQKVLGNTTGLDNKLIERVFSDNPMGQSNEQTPLIMVQF